jgi:hypothetical protein
MALLGTFGFTCVLKLQRMHANGNLNEFKPQVYAVTSVDVCGY